MRPGRGASHTGHPERGVWDQGLCSHVRDEPPMTRCSSPRLLLSLRAAKRELKVTHQGKVLLSSLTFVKAH